MGQMFAINWSEVFIPSVSVGEIILRGTLVYLGIFCLTRLVLRREAGTIGLPDLLMVVLIADAAQNAMAADYRSITDGMILVATIIFWNFTLDFLAYHIPLVHRFVHPPSLLLVKDGRMIRKNMRREFVTEDDLMTEVRRAGVEDLSKVREARMEGDGRISVISDEAPENPPDESPKGGVA